MTPEFDPNEPWDNLHRPSRPELHWSTDNVGEAVPGVMSPLSASIWTELGETCTRQSFVEFGALSPKEGRLPPRLEDRYVGVFCGRFAMQVELMTLLGDRLPGASGQDMAKALFGTVPDDIEYRPTKARYPAIAWKLSRTFLRMPGRLRREPPKYELWWRRSLDTLRDADLAASRALLSEAYVEFVDALTLQSAAVSGHAQVVHEALSGVIESAGTGDFGVLSGTGGAEMAVIEDIWDVSRGRLTLEQLVQNHGFHGPLEGEVSSVVWREDPAPLEKVISEYANRPDSDDPRLREDEMRARLPDEQARVLAALPRARRPGARLVLNMAAKRIPLRGVAKRSFLQGLDVIRACTRRIGAELTRHALSRRLRGALQGVVIKALEEKENAIVFIDELHTIVGAGAASGGAMDASNLLKPALANGKSALHRDRRRTRSTAATSRRTGRWPAVSRPSRSASRRSTRRSRCSRGCGRGTRSSTASATATSRCRQAAASCRRGTSTIATCPTRPST